MIEIEGEGVVEAPPRQRRDLGQALWRGARCRCPACGRGAMFDGYLTVRPVCTACGEELFHHRADDAPPYFTILVVGHVIVSLVLAVEIAFHPPLWVHAALWIPLTILTAMLCLRPIKGMVVGLQWALFMHGFDPEHDADAEYAAPVGHP